MITSKNTSINAGACKNKTNANAYCTPKYYPPYGKQLDAIRRSGLIPDNRVIVSTDWEIGKAYPRIVIIRKLPIYSLRFEYLAGLAVQIVHFDHDANILSDLIEAVRKAKPAILATFNMDAIKESRPAFKLIYSEGKKESNV